MRHSRQIGVFGEEGQARIERSTVGIVGLGGLGCSVITHLASAGVGKLIIADHQYPDESNLNRQFIYSHYGIDRKKTSSSKEWIESISSAEVEVIDERIDSDSIRGMRCDVLVDCTDDNGTRLIMNRHIHDVGIPMVYGGVESMFGQVSTIIPESTPCLECFLRPRIRDDIPSVMPAVSFIASVQSAEVLKLMTGTGRTLAGMLMTADLENNIYRTVSISRRPDCPVCNGF